MGEKRAHRQTSAPGKQTVYTVQRTGEDAGSTLLVTPPAESQGKMVSWRQVGRPLFWRCQSPERSWKV